ncbi:MAG: hypothetical protein K2L11_09845 [Muribaculaceae bacterium]|nr:hypothetical protein [Muribaculaceae bacterium]
MKRTTFILTLLLTSLIANALTVEKLLKGYRNKPDIQYNEVKGKELKALADSVSTEVEKEALRDARKLVVMGSMMDEEQLRKLSSKLNTLDDYSLALEYTVDLPEQFNSVSSALNGQEPSVSVDIYSKNSSSSEYLIKPVFLINMWGMVALAYLDGKIKPDTAKEFVDVTFHTGYSLSASSGETGKKQSAIERIDHQRNI